MEWSSSSQWFHTEFRFPRLSTNKHRISIRHSWFWLICNDSSCFEARHYRTNYEIILRSFFSFTFASPGWDTNFRRCNSFQFRKSRHLCYNKLFIHQAAVARSLEDISRVGSLCITTPSRNSTITRFARCSNDGNNCLPASQARHPKVHIRRASIIKQLVSSGKSTFTYQPTGEPRSRS